MALKQPSYLDVIEFAKSHAKLSKIDCIFDIDPRKRTNFIQPHWGILGHILYDRIYKENFGVWRKIWKNIPPLIQQIIRNECKNKLCDYISVAEKYMKPIIWTVEDDEEYDNWFSKAPKRQGL